MIRDRSGNVTVSHAESNCRSSKPANRGSAYDEKLCKCTTNTCTTVEEG